MKKDKLFELGQVSITRGISDLTDSDDGVPFVVYLSSCLDRHQRGDWGLVPKQDARENNLAVKQGFRILSSYPIAADSDGKRMDDEFWIITEADRSVTTILLPSEY